MTGMDEYRYWRLALEGKAGEWTGPDPLMHPAPQCGFWKLRNGPRGAAWSAVAIWRHDGELVAIQDSQPVGPNHVWARCGAHPVSHEAYTARIETGTWPGEIPHEIGHNAPPDEFDLLKENIADAAAQAEKWLAELGEIKTDADSDKAANYRDLLNKLEKKAETRRKEEKEPLAEQVKAIDQKYGIITSRAKTVANALRNALTLFMRKKEDAERARLAAERQRAEKERQELAGRDIALAAMEPPLPEQKPTPVRAGGQLGRATGLRTKTVAVITDRAAALAHFADHPSVIEVIDRLCQAEARSKTRKDIPGVEFKEERYAA